MSSWLTCSSLAFPMLLVYIATFLMWDIEVHKGIYWNKRTIKIQGYFVFKNHYVNFIQNSIFFPQTNCWKGNMDHVVQFLAKFRRYENQINIAGSIINSFQYICWVQILKSWVMRTYVKMFHIMIINVLIFIPCSYRGTFKIFL